MKTTLLAIAVLTVLWSACAPNPPAPVKMMILAPDATGSYKTQQVEVKTLTDVTAFKGTVADFLGNARIVVDPQDPLLASFGNQPTDAQLSEIVQKDKGGDVRGNFIEKAGVWWPADFHTWNMATLYWNLEQASLYWNDVYGTASSAALTQAKVLYWASYQDLNIGKDDVTDNALFFSLVPAFVVLPFKEPASLQKVPFSLNLGVVAHEYAHWVFNRRAFAGALLPAPANPNWWPNGFNVVKAIDEGFADFHGYSVTCRTTAGCRPSFLSVSLEDQNLALSRDISNPGRCIDAGLRAAILTQTGPQFLASGNQYRLGTLIATSLFQASLQAGDKLDLMQKALFDSYDDERPGTPGFKQLFSQYATNPQGFTPELMANTILSHITDPELKRLTCNQLLDRLALECDAPPCMNLPACPSTSSKGSAGCL
ncbi:MAG: hypothetical protein K1X64_09115 [Myxococcaceae bacterium]|nr:hypothetical protein [Myxococcaceae bacterium]